MIANVGVYANTHYCGGVLTHLGWFENADEQDQCECAAVKKTDCCDDIQIKSTVKTESVINSTFQIKTVVKILNPIFAHFSAFNQINSSDFFNRLFTHKWRFALPNSSLMGTTTTILRF